MNRTASVTTLSPLATRTDAEIEAILDAAFGADRHGRTAYAIRLGCAWLADFSYAVSDDSGVLLGVLQSWPVELRCDDGNATASLIMVGPVAILPENQGEGLGQWVGMYPSIAINAAGEVALADDISCLVTIFR